MSAGSSGPGQVTVRLYPLFCENWSPVIVVDILVFAGAYGAWLSAGLPDNGSGVGELFLFAFVAALGHVAQMCFAAVRFDDGMTITRPWRLARRVRWARISALPWRTRLGSRPSNSRSSLMLYRQVQLAGAERRPGVAVTRAERRAAVRVPVVMITDLLTWQKADSGKPRARCQRRIVAELKRHGIAVPDY